MYSLPTFKKHFLRSLKDVDNYVRSGYVRLVINELIGYI